MTNKKRNIIIISSIAALAAIILLFSFLYPKFKQKTTEGSKTISVQVVFADKSTKDYEIKTNAVYLRQALEEIDLIKGDENQYGLFVKTVADVTADDSKQQWWCFTKDGTSINTSVDSTPIKDKDKFEITLKTGY